MHAQKALLVCCVTAVACRRAPQKVAIRADPVAAPSASASPVAERFDAFVRDAISVAGKGGYEVSLVWARASCSDKDGRLATTCSGKTWSGTPVFGITGAVIPTTGFFSAEFWRVGPGGARDRFGVTAFGAQWTTATLAEGVAHPPRGGPHCRLTEAFARATAQGFGAEGPFKIILQTADDKYPTEWRFVRDSEELTVVDDCSVAPEPVLTRSFMEPYNSDCYREGKCRTFAAKDCPAKWEGKTFDAAATTKYGGDGGEKWCCYVSTVCEFPEK